MGATFAAGAQLAMMHVVVVGAATSKSGAVQTRDSCAATVHMMMERNATMGTVSATMVVTTCAVSRLDGRAVWTQRQALIFAWT